MKTLGGFAVALMRVHCDARNFHAASGWSDSGLLVAVAVCCLCGLPFLLLGGVPAWLLLRRFGIHSLVAFTCSGAALGWIACLFVIAVLWPGIPFDPGTTFIETLGRSDSMTLMLAAAVAGASGGCVFRLVAVLEQRG